VRFEEAYRVFRSNHLGAYNVLFTDGSVKTFSDSGNSVRREIFLATDYNTGTCPDHGPYIYFQQMSHPYGPTLARTVWTPYFDPLYAQD
ncbi:MAG: H-X9-DG-CTERM domain-containing protein, partial [Planctomycetota bacterium]